tara:strand:+ start:2033 stop:2440 length:408 start_codon:yes stop_codon:yes gene_type:complete
MVDLNELERFFKNNIHLLPDPNDPNVDPEDPLGVTPQEMKDYDAIQNSEDYVEEKIIDTEPPYYVIARVHKSQSLNKKIVIRNYYINEVWEPTGEIRGKSVTGTDMLPYAYDDDIGQIEMAVVGSRFIDTRVEQE